MEYEYFILPILPDLPGAYPILYLKRFRNTEKCRNDIP